MYVTPHPLPRYTLAEYLRNEKSVFVNGRSRAAIMEDMDRRITRGDFEAEKTEAINVLSTLSLPLSSTFLLPQLPLNDSNRPTNVNLDESRPCATLQETGSISFSYYETGK